MKPATVESCAPNARLHIHQPDGSVQRVGHGGPVIDWHLHTPGTLLRILKHPHTELGASYVRGEWDIDTRQLPQLIQALVPYRARGSRSWSHALFGRLRRSLGRGRSAKPVPPWESTSLWLSRLCLGEELHQGCGLYAEPGITLEQAQRLDRQRLLQQLQLEPVHQVLDLDAGWGTRALFLAEETGVQVTAFARSMRQFEYLRHEARRRGLERLVHVRSGSFLQCRGLFDRVLAGDFLHHRRATEPRLALQHLAGLLRDDGFLWLGFPGRSHDVRLSNHWYRRQLATRGELPLLSRLSRALESTSLKPLLIEERSSHRLRTLQERARRFHRHRSAISRRFGETNTRHWEFLLASESTALQWGQLNYYEMLLGNPRCAWPAAGHDNSSWVHDLPAELVNAIPGLARDI